MGMIQIDTNLEKLPRLRRVKVLSSQRPQFCFISFPDSTNIANSLSKQKAYWAKISRGISISNLGFFQSLIKYLQALLLISCLYASYCFQKYVFKKYIFNNNIFQYVQTTFDHIYMTPKIFISYESFYGEFINL